MHNKFGCPNFMHYDQLYCTCLVASDTDGFEFRLLYFHRNLSLRIKYTRRCQCRPKLLHSQYRAVQLDRGLYAFYADKENQGAPCNRDVCDIFVTDATSGD
jgi:hypothetical protein